MNELQEVYINLLIKELEEKERNEFLKVLESKFDQETLDYVKGMAEEIVEIREKMDERLKEMDNKN